MVLRMKVSDIEVLTRHSGPESCGGAREGIGEALTGVRVGWVLSREKLVISGADPVGIRGRQKRLCRFGEAPARPARSETPCMHVRTMCGNREVLRFFEEARSERIVKPKGIRR